MRNPFMGKDLALVILMAFVLTMGAGCCDVCKMNADEAKMYAIQATASAAKADSAARNAEMAAVDAKASADKAEGAADRAEAAGAKSEARLMKRMRPPKFKKAIPIRHVWDTLRYEGCEKKGYGMYTYVLFGRRVDNLASVSPEIAKRYENLLYAIISSTPTTREARHLMKGRSNIFYIPSKVNLGAGKFSLKDYNSSLAMSYIARLADMIKNNTKLVERFDTRPGPFLISVRYRLGKISKGNFMLYADLSECHQAAIEEIVVAYKNHITTEGVNTIEEFDSLRLKILNFILFADEDLKVVRAEAAEWQRIYKAKQRPAPEK